LRVPQYYKLENRKRCAYAALSREYIMNKRILWDTEHEYI